MAFSDGKVSAYTAMTIMSVGVLTSFPTKGKHSSITGSGWEHEGDVANFGLSVEHYKITDALSLTLNPTVWL